MRGSDIVAKVAFISGRVSQSVWLLFFFFLLVFSFLFLFSLAVNSCSLPITRYAGMVWMGRRMRVIQ